MTSRSNWANARRGLEDHPTVKPIAMLADALFDLTNRRENVLDPFRIPIFSLAPTRTTSTAWLMIPSIELPSPPCASIATLTARSRPPSGLNASRPRSTGRSPGLGETSAPSSSSYWHAGPPMLQRWPTPTSLRASPGRSGVSGMKSEFRIFGTLPSTCSALTGVLCVINPHRPRPVRETDEWLWESAVEFCAALDHYAGRTMEIKSASAPAARPPTRAERNSPKSKTGLDLRALEFWREVQHPLPI